MTETGKAYIIDNIAVSPTSSKALMSQTGEGSDGQRAASSSRRRREREGQRVVSSRRRCRREREGPRAVRREA